MIMEPPTAAREWHLEQATSRCYALQPLKLEPTPENGKGIGPGRAGVPVVWLSNWQPRRIFRNRGAVLTRSKFLTLGSQKGLQNFPDLHKKCLLGTSEEIVRLHSLSSNNFCNTVSKHGNQIVGTKETVPAYLWQVHTAPTRGNITAPRVRSNTFYPKTQDHLRKVHVKRTKSKLVKFMERNIGPHASWRE